MTKISQCLPVILAAGKGTRMHSEKPKVLHTLLGQPMLGYVINAVQDVFTTQPCIIIGYKASEIEQAFPNACFIIQSELNGTGGALQQILPSLENSKEKGLFVINGDMPLITCDLIRNFILSAGNFDIAFATMTLDDPGAYGRVVRDRGQVKAIVEAKDYNETKFGKASGEVNTGLYYIAVPYAKKLLPLLKNENAAHELYLTDLISMGINEGLSVEGISCSDSNALTGVNSPLELSLAEDYLAVQTAQKLLKNGVMIHGPAMARINPGVSIEAGAEIFSPCEIYGNTEIKKNAVIESYSFIKDSRIEENAVLKSFSHIEGAIIGKNAIAGPYVRLRPGAILKEASHAGNFVELKKAILGESSKANHLTYLGDCEIGPNTNIGAGTITCNYDGHNKHRTTIGSNAFIGSNTALVAPVAVGNNTLVGAGSVITHDVNDNEIAIARGRQKNLHKRNEK